MLCFSVPSKPVSVSLEPHDTNILVKWEDLPVKDRNGIITEYRIQYKRVGSDILSVEQGIPASAKSFILRSKYGTAPNFNITNN